MAKKKTAKSKFVHYTRCEFDLNCLSTQGATFCEYIGTGMFSPCIIFADRIRPAMLICKKNRTFDLVVTSGKGNKSLNQKRHFEIANKPRSPQSKTIS
jgi:hypothetical protein